MQNDVKDVDDSIDHAKSSLNSSSDNLFTSYEELLGNDKIKARLH